MYYLKIYKNFIHIFQVFNKNIILKKISIFQINYVSLVKLC